MTDQQPLPVADTTPAPDKGADLVAQTPTPPPAETDDRPDTVRAETPAATPPSSAPPPAAAAAAAAVDAAVNRQYQVLAAAVLDSAELATRAAQTAVTMSENLKQTTTEVRKLNAGAHKKALLLAVGSGALMLLCLIFFLLMAVRLNSRVNQLDTMLLAVGKRAVELNTGLAALQDIDAGIKTLIARQNELTQAQAAIDARVESVLKQPSSLVQQVPGETARQVAESSDSMARQIGTINRQLQTQAGTLQSLGAELKSLRTGLAGLALLQRDVERLLQQRAERAPDSPQKNTAAALRERTVHYPRVLPRTDAAATAATAEPSPAISVR